MKNSITIPKKNEKENPSSKSVGAIVLNKKLQTLLVFQAKNKYWEFPKGKMEAGETELDTLQREIYEETGIKKFRVVKGFKKQLNYEFPYKKKTIQRNVVYFLIMTDDKVNISKEHMQYAWLTLERAKDRLKHESQKALIDIVIAKINK